MEPASPEQEKPQDNEPIRLNQDFHPFAGEVSTSFSSNPILAEITQYHAKIALATDILPNFHLKVGALASKHSTIPVIDIFHPEIGYPITAEDFADAEKRKEKFAKLNWGEKSGESFQEAPLSWYMFANYAELENLGLVHREPPFYAFNSEALSVFNRLRLQIMAKGLLLEAKPSVEKLREGRVELTDFYPGDTGPLTRVDHFLTEGLLIAMPSDLEKLKTITGRFVLAPEKPSADDPGVLGKGNGNHR